jgi:hypothetical protein
MTLGDLIEHLRSDILHDRSTQIIGASSSYLWSDKTLALYINEAQRRLAKKAGILRDGVNPGVTRFTTTANVAMYALHPAILSVMSVRLGDDVADLPRSKHNDIDTYRRLQSDVYFFDTSTIATLPNGRPRSYSTDEYMSVADDGTQSRVNLRLWPTPSADYAGIEVAMRVTRLPLEPLTADNPSAVPEVPEEYHLQMLDWAAYLALRIVDVDAGQAQRAAEFRDSFNAYVEEINIEHRTKQLQPVTVAFGSGGFYYERD